jgi:hypothetical protein
MEDAAGSEIGEGIDGAVMVATISPEASRI